MNDIMDADRPVISRRFTFGYYRFVYLERMNRPCPMDHPPVHKPAEDTLARMLDLVGMAFVIGVVLLLVNFSFVPV